ncbi:hypothetical protein E2E30_03115 [Sphingomonas sp. AAP5]|uniref:hypothetical protein n=1 Tax=Sphingomonas sp. AAP5 TaxID=1523415 RepID=UPI0010574B8E|nr:hypothetical protein [Sphingomonas sp. AAP5]QBM74858.1 hypothetical protein E2E30_03115 [Sphingomonas sp. AAP5]
MEERQINPKKEFETEGGTVVIHKVVLDGPAERCIVGRYKDATFKDFDISYDLNGRALRENSKWNLDLQVPDVLAFIEALREARRTFVGFKR